MSNGISSRPISQLNRIYELNSSTPKSNIAGHTTLNVIDNGRNGQFQFKYESIQNFKKSPKIGL